MTRKKRNGLETFLALEELVKELIAEGEVLGRETKSRLLFGASPMRGIL